MHRRNILRDVKPKAPPGIKEELEAPPAPKVEAEPELGEDEVFKKPGEKAPAPEVLPPSEPELEAPPTPAPKRRGRRPMTEEHKEKARAQLAKNREKKERERYEELRKKYEKTERVPQFDPPPEPEPTPPPPTQPVVSERQQPYAHVGSANVPDAHQNVIDYERLITGISERFERQFLTDKEVKERMRQEAMRDARTEVDLYRDKYTNLQRKQTVDMLSNNRVFQRTQSIKDQYRGRVTRGWYRR